MTTLTEAELARILADLRNGNVMECDVTDLEAYCEHQSDRLSDCWLLLDCLAQTQSNEIARSAARLLKRQGCPSWKKKILP
mgnify:CR=1 FL=1